MNDLLITAASNGWEDAVRNLINKGVSVNSEDSQGRVALMLAAENGHLKIVSELLNAGAIIDLKDTHGWTALMTAGCRGHLHVVRELLNRGADIHAKSNVGSTTLIISALGGHTSVVQELLERGADINEKDNAGRTALWYVATERDDAFIQELLDLGADIGAKDNDGRTVLWHAIFRMYGEQEYARSDWYNYDGSAEYYARLARNIRVLLNAFANNGESEKTQDYSSDYLGTAVITGQSWIVTELLKIGVDVNQKDNKGNTPLMKAIQNCFNDNFDIIDALLANGADINATDIYGMDALIVAARYGTFRMVLKLLASGANVKTKDCKNKTALEWSRDLDNYSRKKEIEEAILERMNQLLILAASNGQYAEVCDLLKLGASANSKESTSGISALMLAAGKGYADIVRALLAGGANVNEKDCASVTALMKAAEEGHIDVVRELLARGANVNDKDKDDWTALMAALRNGHVDVCFMLQEAGAR